VRNAVLTGAKPNESVVADRRMLGEERWSSAARAVGATRRLLRFEVLDPLFYRFLIEAPVRAHLKAGIRRFFKSR
jgi:hypothetical protein